MKEQDKTKTACPKCQRKTYYTGIWADQNPTLRNGKKACVECKVADIYATFLDRPQRA